MFLKTTTDMIAAPSIDHSKPYPVQRVEAAKKRGETPEVAFGRIWAEMAQAEGKRRRAPNNFSGHDGRGLRKDSASSQILALLRKHPLTYREIRKKMSDSPKAKIDGGLRVLRRRGDIQSEMLYDHAVYTLTESATLPRPLEQTCAERLADALGEVEQ